MHIWRKAFVAPVDSVGQSLSRFWRDLTAAATIEFIFLTPVILTMIGLVVAGGEGFELNRKITMVVRTLADLASQQTNIGTSSSTYTYTQLLNAASLVIQPYDSSQLSLVLSEVSANGAGTGVVKWSQGNTAAVANSMVLTAGATVSVPTNITAAGYLILGSARYNFQPLGIYLPIAAFPITDSLYLAPRQGTSGVACCS